MSGRRSPLTAARVRELLDCDPEAGTLTWRNRPGNKRWNTRYAGKLAGTAPSKHDGYRRIRLDSNTYLLHRVLWLHFKGYSPPAYLDHQDGNRANNTISNLRPASAGANNCNRDSRSKHGNPRGSWFNPKLGKYEVRIRPPGGKRKLVGLFATAEAADRAYKDAAADLHGEFALCKRPAPFPADQRAAA